MLASGRAIGRMARCVPLLSEVTAHATDPSPLLISVSLAALISGCLADPSSKKGDGTSANTPKVKATGETPTKDKQADPPAEVKKDEPLVPFNQWNFELLSKTYGLKMKSPSYTADPPPDPMFGGTRGGTYNFVLEQTKDLTPEELGKIRMAFNPRAPQYIFTAFDEDMVVLRSYPISSNDVITGVKGDAFRVDARLQPGFMMKETARVEVRANR